MSEPRDPQATVTDPGGVETVDALSAGARARLPRGPDPGARARPAAALPPSAISSAPAIGRYQVLEVVGQGGMGMVLAAWDPQLERRVALKLVRWTSPSSRERMLREGQLLARLSHPNVVPVFDVGAVDDQVYLVMEYVRGATLREYAASAPGPRAILDAYRQAGAGLAAAHARGVIHRDFKPENAIRGEDGRVRVLDFGIAHEGEGAADRAGTPRYMAPEQQRADAGPPTASVDQYALCVALREALDAQGGAPAWLATILDRGGAADPAQRFSSLDDLLAALARDPARRRRWIALGAGLTAAAIGAFLVGQRTERAAAVEPCAGGEAALATAWGPASHARLAQHLRGLGARDALGRRLTEELDRYAGAWVSEQRAACLAHERRALSAELHAVRLGCLDRARTQLAAVAELGATADAAGLDNALLAAQMMPDVHGCAEVVDLVAPPPAPLATQVAAIGRDVERALVLVAAWRAEAPRAADAAADAARATGYEPLRARALLAQGRAAIQVGRPDAARILEAATQSALAASDDPLAVEAYARWVFARAKQGAPAADNLAVMEALASRLGQRGRFARALLYHNLGISRIVAADPAGAHRWLTRALAEATGAPELELAVIGQSLANLEPDPQVSLARMRDTYDRYLRALGPDHRQTILTRTFVGAVTPDRRQARDAYSDCAGLDGSPLTECTYDAGWLADEAGDHTAATRLMDRLREAGAPLGPLARAYVELRRTSALSAPTLSTLADLTSQPASYPIYRSDAEVLLALGSAGATAERAWTRARDALKPAQLAVYRRRSARIAAELAHRWAASRPAEATLLAQEALTWYRYDPTAAALADSLATLTARGSR